MRCGAQSPCVRLGVPLSLGENVVIIPIHMDSKTKLNYPKSHTQLPFDPILKKAKLWYHRENKRGSSSDVIETQALCKYPASPFARSILTANCSKETSQGRKTSKQHK